MAALPSHWIGQQAGGNVPGLMGIGGQPAIQYPGWGVYGYPSAATLPYEFTPVAALFTGDVSLPLGDHLLSATKEKILRGEFVDIFSLLFRELEKKDKGDLDEKDNEKRKNRKVDRTWANWLPGFFIYAGVISHA